MPFTLEQVVPWGRNFEEYAAMFALDHRDLGGRILGCGDGPASFNAEATARGVNVTSCDPLYQFTPAQIAARVDEVYPVMLQQTRENADGFVWDRFSSVEQLGDARRAAMRRFLSDYQSGSASGRYVAADVSALPFGESTFTLAVSSHFLLLYSAQLSLDFHLAAVRELCRVAREVRIFPILDLARRQSRHLEPLTAALTSDGRDVRLERVNYEFQRSGHTMLRVGRRLALEG